MAVMRKTYWGTASHSPSPSLILIVTLEVYDPIYLQPASRASLVMVTWLPLGR
jgi:hypothetical protein